MRIWWLRGVLGGLFLQATVFTTFSPAMKCNHYNKFLSLSFDSISASLKTSLESIHSWVKFAAMIVQPLMHLW